MGRSQENSMAAFYSMAERPCPDSAAREGKRRQNSDVVRNCWKSSSSWTFMSAFHGLDERKSFWRARHEQPRPLARLAGAEGKSSRVASDYWSISATPRFRAWCPTKWAEAISRHEF